MDPDKEYPDPHPEEDAWNTAKKFIPKGQDEQEFRKLHKENYHLGCPECSHIKAHNKMVQLNKSFKNIEEGLVDAQAARMSGICRNCSSLRDIYGRCGCK